MAAHVYVVIMTAAPHFGLILALTIRGLAVGNYRDMRQVAAVAEALDFDSIWLCDHFLTLPPASYGHDAGMNGGGGTADTATLAGSSMPLLECWTALSALARDTTRLRLGTSVLCNSYRLPSVVAKMAATLDVISDGRVEVGLGAGWFEKEYRAYGIPFPRTAIRIAQLDEGIEVIRRMWTHASPTFRGAHYTVDGAICDPPPVQRPHPPIWVGGEGDKVHRVAARAADGVNVRWWSPEHVEARAEFLDTACREFGRDPSALRRSVTLVLFVHRNRSVIASMRERFAAIPGDGIVAGTPDECIVRIGEYIRAGVDHLLFAIPDVAASPTLELAGREVLAAVRHQLRRPA
jgi:probable F420-dependent oxidoreductase